MNWSRNMHSARLLPGNLIISSTARDNGHPALPE